VPGGAEPGRIQRQLQPKPGPPPSPEITAPQLPQAVPPAEAAKIHFTLRAIVIDGSTVYTPDQLQPLYANLIGKEVSLLAIYRIADTITVKYRSDGYILSRAVVPAQRVVDGKVHIRVVEGFIDKVIIEGKKTPAIESYADQLTLSRPLREKDLERYLLLVNDLPGVQAFGALSPAKGVLGGSDLTIVVKQKRFDVYSAFDDRGTKYVGPLELSSEAAVNDPFGLSDRIGFRYVTTPADEQELRYFELDYEVPIGAQGIKFSLFTSGVTSHPGNTLQTNFLQTDTSGETVIAKLSYPLIRSRARNLFIDASFMYLDSIVDQMSLPSLTPLTTSYADHIRAFRAGASYDTTDTLYGHDFAHLEVSQGVPIFGATPSGKSVGVSRPGAQSTFTKATLDASRVQDLDKMLSGLDLLTAASAGGSFGEGLLAAEQFGVGGPTFGRGYDPSEITGDYGAAGKAELQYNFRVPVSSGTPPQLQAFTFYDFGAVADQNPRLLDESAMPRTLASTGFGLRANWTGHILASLEADKPLTRVVAAYANNVDKKPWRLFFTITARY
jgi:hemolysin activation/secretion protein